MSTPSSSSRRKKCILTFARSWNGLAATRCLGKHGIYVITGDTDAVAAANFSKYSKEQFVYPDPNRDPEGFIDKLVSIARVHAAPDTDLVVMPLFTDVYVIMCHQDRFKGLAQLAVPPIESYELARSKARLALFCNEQGIRIPPTIVVKSVEEFYARAREADYPAFVKIPTGSAAIGTCKVTTSSEAVRVFDDMCKRYTITDPELLPILQTAVGGEDFCSTFLFDHGTPCVSMTYHNILDYPRGKGMGAVRETVEAGPLEQIGNRILHMLNWNGVCEMDFRWDRKNEPWLIEINPRFWGGLAQSIESGWTYPAWLYELAMTGRCGTKRPEKRDVRTHNPGLTILRMIQDFSDARDSMPEIAKAYHEFRYENKEKDFTSVMQFIGKVTNAVDIPARLKAVVNIMKHEQGSINEFFSWDDPFPVLGLLYPLMVYIKHGSLSPELLVGEKVLHTQDSNRRSRRCLKKDGYS